MLPSTYLFEESTFFHFPSLVKTEFTYVASFLFESIINRLNYNHALPNK